jgi:AAA+ superfamily predicted ATPase
MGTENFIRDALLLPNDVIAYHVGRELAEMYPQKSIVEGRNWYFDLDAYVRAEKCAVIADKSVFHQVKTDWEGNGKKEKQRIENSWLNVLWGGQLFDVILITWVEDCYRRRHHWVIADDLKTANSFVAAVCEWSFDVRGEIVVYQDGYFQKNKELYNSIKNATFDNLVLRDTLKSDIQNDFEQFFNSREMYEQYHIPWKRGAIFIGPPGNGKTHTIKALINKLGKPTIYVRSFKADYGTEQENMAEVFKRARMTTPCIVVLEDLDSMIDEKNRAFFLNELDGFETNTGVVVLATTNHPEKLDTTILDRPSRFDRKYNFDLPAESERLSYINNWNNQLQSELRVSEQGTPEITRQTEGFSFAYMKELFIASMVQWMSSGGKSTMDEVILEQVKLLRTQSNLKKIKKKKDSKK